MSNVTALHNAVKQGDISRIRALLAEDPRLANARSESDPRGTFPLHVTAEFGQAGAARLLLEHGADVTLLDFENDATALGWAAFFGRSGVVAVLLDANSNPSQRTNTVSRRSAAPSVERRENGSSSPTQRWPSGKAPRN